MTAQVTPQDGRRYILPLDRAGWRWTEGRHRRASAGLPVTLPHCWNAGDESRPGIRLRRGWATYQLDFDPARLAPDREWRLRCDGFYGAGQAWLNGRSIGQFNGDYLGLDLDVTQALHAGANRLVIEACNRWSRSILPGIPDPDFHLYGGLGGGMHLIALPPVRVLRRDSQVVMEPSRPGEIGVVIGMANRGAAGAAPMLQIAVRDPTGAVVAMPDPQAIALPPGRTASPARNTACCCC